MANLELIAKQFAILDHMPVGAFVLQEDLVVIFWNSRLEDWTGIPRRKILGENITTHFPNLKTPSYTLRIQDVFNTGMSFIFSPYLHKYSIPIMLPDNQTQIQATTVTRVPGLNDTESYVLFSIQDVTELACRIRDYRLMRDQAQREVKERQQAERALQQVNTELAKKNAQLKELNASKDKFFSIISHDLRSPFNTLLGFAQLLEENLEHYSLDEIRHKVGRVLTSAERLYGLLENLLTWSRIQRGGMEYRPGVGAPLPRPLS